MKRTRIVATILVIAILILFVCNPEENIKACLLGLNIWAISWVPALLPFFILTKLLSELGFINFLAKKSEKITYKLFKVSGASSYIFMFSIISGYPIGAKLTYDCFNKGLITKEEAYKITTFTSNSGPMFILGTVAVGMFGNIKIGIIVLISHILGAIVNGIFYRNYKLKNNININTIKNLNYNTEKHNEINLEDIMYTSIKSILIVGGYISIFFMIINLINNIQILKPINLLLYSILKPIGLTPLGTTSITNGIIEMTKGCLLLSQSSISTTLIIPIATAIITFGGLSIHMQSLTFLKKIEIKTSFYFIQKLTHVIFSTFISILLCFFML